MLHTLMRVTLFCMIAISGAAAEPVVIEADCYLDVVAGRIVSPAVMSLLADLIAVAGNPLENVRLLEDVRFLMKDGVVYKQPD